MPAPPGSALPSVFSPLSLSLSPLLSPPSYRTLPLLLFLFLSLLPPSHPGFLSPSLRSSFHASGTLYANQQHGWYPLDLKSRRAPRSPLLPPTVTSYQTPPRRPARNTTLKSSGSNVSLTPPFARALSQPSQKRHPPQNGTHPPIPIPIPTPGRKTTTKIGQTSARLPRPPMVMQHSKPTRPNIGSRSPHQEEDRPVSARPQNDERSLAAQKQKEEILEAIMTTVGLLVCLLTLSSFAIGERVKRQTEDDPEAFLKGICAGKGPGEWFRLELKDCRDVYQCTEGGLQALRCPHGLAFDLDLQTCDWRGSVKNCNEKVKERKAQPLLNTPEPLCEDSQNQLACGDNTCIARELFCDGKEDCADGSDENACDIARDPNAAPPCNKAECALPECFCYNNPYETPASLKPETIPQMIMITFDDAVNNNNIDLYTYIFNNERKNPNGCSIKATFFVSHKYTNYTAVQELYRQGHEVAVHSISHNDSESFWTTASKEEWAKEMAGGREIIKNFANISDQVIYGVRAPYLRVGGNNQFTMMEENFFLYDSTITAPLQNPPLWPYMLFYRMPHTCHGNGQVCPTRSFAIWEIVMNEMDRREDPNIEEDLPGCAMVDSCFSTRPTAEQFYNFLNNNFNRHYDTNRAPMGLFFHSAFLKNDQEILDMFLYWLDETLASYPDVYFVTMTQSLLWIQDPQPISTIGNYEAWKEACLPAGAPFCPGTAHNCELNTEELSGETVRFSTCMTCPNRYPWLNDPQGLGRIGF